MFLSIYDRELVFVLLVPRKILKIVIVQIQCNIRHCLVICLLNRGLNMLIKPSDPYQINIIFFEKVTSFYIFYMKTYNSNSVIIESNFELDT